MGPTSSRLIALTSLTPIFLALGASAATYQWAGTSSSDWAVAGNWATGSGLTAGPAPSNTTAAHRLNVNNAAGNGLVYSAAQGTTNYGSSTVRGLAIGSGSSGTMTITGGTFSSLNATGSSPDVIGNGAGISGTLTINGGTFIGAAAGTGLGIGGGPTCTLNVQSGTATLTTLSLNNTTGTINVTGGTLALNKVTRTAGTNTINLNGGTLQARQTDAAFIPTGINAINAVSTSTIDTNGFDVSINGAISGSGTLNKNSIGKLTLTANNTYNGNVVVNGGTLALAPSTVTTFAGTTSGAGALEIGGTGLVTLTEANTHAGATTVLSGASLGGEGSVSGALTFNGTHSFFFDPSTTGAGQNFTAGSIDASAATITITPSATASGPGIVVMEAAGGIIGNIGTNFLGNSRLSLSFNVGGTQLLADYTPASLKWTGADATNPTFWDSGVTANWDNRGSADSFQAGDNVLFDDTATSFTVDVKAALNAGNISFNNTGKNDYTIIGSAIGGSGNLSKSGDAFLYLKTANTYSGTTTITDGRTVAGNNAALGSTAGGTTVSGTGSLDINGRNLGAEVITISGDGDGSGALINNGAQQTDAIGPLVLASDATIGGSTRWDMRNSTPTFDMGGFVLTKAGTNYVGLVSVAVSNPGNIDVSEGVFSIQNSTAMGGSSSNTLIARSGATLSSYNAENPIPWSLVLKNSSILRSEGAVVATDNQWTGPVTLEDAGTITVDAVGTMTISGAISGTGSAINKTGAQVAFLSGTNGYTGNTSVSAGSLVLQNATALGTADAGTTVESGARVEVNNLTITDEDITIAGDGGNGFGALQGRTGSSVWTGDVSVNSNLTRIGAQAGATLEVSGVISSTADHNVVFRSQDDTATVILSATNTYTGPTSIIGGVVSVGNIGSVAGGPSNLGSPATVENGTIKMGLGAAGTLRYTGSGEVTDRVIDLQGTTHGAILDHSGTGLLKFTSDLTATGAGSKTLYLQGSSAGTGELDGAIVDNLPGTNRTSIAKRGASTWVLSGTNTFTGGVLIEGGVLRITNSSALGSGIKTIRVSGWAGLELDGSGGNITLPPNFTLLITNGLTNVIHNIAGNNVMTSNLLIPTGVYGDTRTIIVSDNASSLNIAGNVKFSGIGVGSGTRTFVLAGDSVANNVFSGVLDNVRTPSLAKSDAGTWTLTGTNTYTGATTVTGGTLIIGSTGSIDTSASLSIAAGAELDTTAKASHTLPAAVTIGLNGDTATSGLIDATGQALDIDGATVTFNVTGTLAAPAYVLANYGSISGTQAFASIAAPEGYRINYTYNGGTQIALVQSSTEYEAWMDLYPSLTGADKLPTADPDGDGLTNEQEYAYYDELLLQHTNPALADSDSDGMSDGDEIAQGRNPLIAELVVSNLTAAQRPGTKLVDIAYDVTAKTPTVKVTLQISSDGGTTYSVPVTAVSGAIGNGVTVGTGKTITWDAGVDWDGKYSPQTRFRVVADDLQIQGLSLIPAGTFTMGDGLDGIPDAPPVTVNVSAFYIGKYEVTKAEWDDVRAWGLSNGYTDLATGGGKASNHPVHSISWFDMVKWCNARSEKEGLTPVYTVSGAVMKTGATVPIANWSANGYRLPTEAEWEKAARGGVSGKRFPWGTDTISHSQANYRASSSYPYDLSGSLYNDQTHPSYGGGTSPVGSLGANAYGLCDMTGNVLEFCWDWYDESTYVNSAVDPRGPAAGTTRVYRGGCFSFYSFNGRVAFRNSDNPTAPGDYYGGIFGFRVSRSLSP